MLTQIEDLAIFSGFGYLASPYTRYAKGLDAAADDVSTLAGHFVRAGISVYSPIVHSHKIAVDCDIDPKDHHIWLPVDKPIAHAASYMVIAGLKGWRDSFGIGEEIKWFKGRGLPIYLLDPESLVLQLLP